MRGGVSELSWRKRRRRQRSRTEESEERGVGRKRRRKEKEAEKGGKLGENSFQFWCVPMIFMYCPKDYLRGYKGIFSYVPKINFSVSQWHVWLPKTKFVSIKTETCLSQGFFNKHPNIVYYVMSQWLFELPNDLPIVTIKILSQR